MDERLAVFGVGVFRFHSALSEEFGEIPGRHVPPRTSATRQNAFDERLRDFSLVRFFVCVHT